MKARQAEGWKVNGCLSGVLALAAPGTDEQEARRRTFAAEDLRGGSIWTPRLPPTLTHGTGIGPA